MKRYIYIFMAMTWFSQTALGNDSTAALKAGGLVLTKTDQVVMEKEVLVISPTDISVTYGFYNTADTVYSSLISFPLPDLNFNDVYYEHPAFPVENSLNYVGFTTTVDGATVPMNINQRLYSKGRDVTEETHKKYPGLPAFSDRTFPEKAEDKDLNGLVQKTAFHWKQSFPPRKTIKVSHHYKPITGNRFIYPQEFSDVKKRWRKTYCLDDGAEQLIEEKINDGTYNLVREVEYILTTGNNWKDTIKDFRLRVETDKPYALSAFCSPDGKGNFIKGAVDLRYEKFSPQSDLIILFLGRFD